MNRARVRKELPERRNWQLPAENQAPCRVLIITFQLGDCSPMKTAEKELTCRKRDLDERHRRIKPGEEIMETSCLDQGESGSEEKPRGVENTRVKECAETRCVNRSKNTRGPNN